MLCRGDEVNLAIGIRLGARDYVMIRTSQGLRLAGDDSRGAVPIK